MVRASKQSLKDMGSIPSWISITYVAIIYNGAIMGVHVRTHLGIIKYTFKDSFCWKGYICLLLFGFWGIQ